MLRKIRAQANFAEYVPLSLAMLAFLELGQTSAVVLHGLGSALLVGRLLHGYAFSFSETFPVGRVGGTALTLLVLITSALLCIGQGVGL